ncbi:hypothetical protein [Flavobacterium limi]|uniref:Uncharacterized protein n=1 Tax=Flavobacterium limi TaxID=2045105 RepID=A0ABQ1UX17_9FLAO|nr:hypothetical protein [Flavobacterium limi]GGF28277.1 hypothetical protein GCM10011518_42000 [Flavobacterium limi]
MRNSKKQLLIQSTFTENAEPDYGYDLSAQEISRESGHKNSVGHRKITNSAPQTSDPSSNPYDSENLDNESDSESKDITEQDIEEDLINNDPSEGFETQIDTPLSDEPEKPVNQIWIIPSTRNSKLANLAMRNLKTMNSSGTKQIMVHSKIINLPSENFNVLRFVLETGS